MGWMSPQDLDDDPKRFLDTPHDLHEDLLEFQEKLFPGFKKKLMEAKVHCLLCEGLETFEVILKDTGEKRVCDGYVGDADNVGSLHVYEKGKR